MGLFKKNNADTIELIDEIDWFVRRDGDSETWVTNFGGDVYRLEVDYLDNIPDNILLFRNDELLSFFNSVVAAEDFVLQWVNSRNIAELNKNY